jgi:hypothetical protein
MVGGARMGRMARGALVCVPTHSGRRLGDSVVAFRGCWMAPCQRPRREMQRVSWTAPPAPRRQCWSGPQGSRADAPVLNLRPNRRRQISKCEALVTSLAWINGGEAAKVQTAGRRERRAVDPRRGLQHDRIEAR